MRWDDAMDRMADRMLATAGLPADERDGYKPLIGAPADLGRKLLYGLMDGTELDAAIEGLGNAATNTVATMVLTSQDPRGGDARAALYVALAQMLVMGLLIGRGPHEDEPEHRSSGEFGGAQE